MKFKHYNQKSVVKIDKIISSSKMVKKTYLHNEFPSENGRWWLIHINDYEKYDYIKKWNLMVDTRLGFENWLSIVDDDTKMFAI